MHHASLVSHSGSKIPFIFPDPHWASQILCHHDQIPKDVINRCYEEGGTLQFFISYLSFICSQKVYRGC